MEPWLAVLDHLNLSKAEKSVVERFRKDPHGRGFLPVADILRTHGKIDESIELLIHGVNQHPQFTVARVVLARELFAKGLISEGYRVLEQATDSLHDNVLAQKLRFKFALLLDDEALAQRVFHHLSMFNMLDDELQELGEKLQNEGFFAAQQVLKKKFADSQIPLVIDQEISNNSKEIDQEEVNVEHEKEDHDELERDQQLLSFHVVPLNEVFHGVSTDVSSVRYNTGVELDSTTLAELYTKQGHYGKALAIYRRLIRMSPNNDYLRRKLREVKALEQKQKDEDLSIDPTIVDQMEAIQIIDAQIEFYQTLLDRLNKRAQRWT